MLALVVVHLGATAAFMELRWEHLTANALLLGLSWSGERGRHFTQLVFPLYLTGLLYDNFRFVEEYRGHIRVAELYEREIQWFGIPANGDLLIPAAWLQNYTNNLLDFVTGLAYILYLWIPIGLAFALYFIDQERMSQLAWSFLIVNVLGMATYLLYPAAPPWYVQDYGLGPAQLDALPSAAGAARFDQMTGLGYFSSFYMRSANVFGAMPSLHAAYPALVVGAVWGMGARWVVPTVLFTLLVAFAAVYLNHHYVWDVLVGIGYGALASLAAGRIVGSNAAAPTGLKETSRSRRVEEGRTI